jgi:hypothetical protein
VGKAIAEVARDSRVVGVLRQRLRVVATPVADLEAG